MAVKLTDWHLYDPTFMIQASSRTWRWAYVWLAYAFMSQYQGYPYGPGPQGFDNAALGPPPQTSGFAIAAIVCGMLGALSGCLPVANVLAIVFAIIAMSAIGRGEARGKGLAIAGIVLSVFGIAWGAALWVFIARIPEVKPVTGREVTQSQRQQLEQMGVIEPEETIELFYAGGLTVKESGVVLTDTRLVTYADGKKAEDCPLKDVADITFTPSTGWLNEASFVLDMGKGKYVTFGIDGQDGGDKLFHKILTGKVAEARKTARKPAIEAESNR